MFTELGRTSCRNLGDAMQLERAADREVEVPAGTIEWNDDVCLLYTSDAADE